MMKIIQSIVLILLTCGFLVSVYIKRQKQNSEEQKLTKQTAIVETKIVSLDKSKIFNFSIGLKNNTDAAKAEGRKPFMLTLDIEKINSKEFLEDLKKKNCNIDTNLDISISKSIMFVWEDEKIINLRNYFFLDTNYAALKLNRLQNGIMPMYRIGYNLKKACVYNRILVARKDSKIESLNELANKKIMIEARVANQDFTLVELMRELIAATGSNFESINFKDDLKKYLNENEDAVVSLTKISDEGEVFKTTSFGVINEKNEIEQNPNLKIIYQTSTRFPCGYVFATKDVGKNDLMAFSRVIEGIFQTDDKKTFLYNKLGISGIFKISPADWESDLEKFRKNLMKPEYYNLIKQ